MSFWLFDRMKQAGDQIAIAHDELESSYRELGALVNWWQEALHEHGITGRVVSIEGDYGVESIAALLAAMRARNIVVPISRDSRAHLDEFLEIAEVEYRVATGRGPSGIEATGREATHLQYRTLQKNGAAGLVLFSSGSTGKSKGVVHNLDGLLEKFRTPRHCYRTLVFLQLDHIGGLNTLFYTLSNAGTVVVAAGRMPGQVCDAIARHRVELLPTSPTFLNLLLLSEEHQRHDLSSLQLITYGTEPMPEATLRRTEAAFPGVRMLQTYGLSELGILRSQSRGPGSLWVRVGGEGYETKIVDGRLWIRAKSAMLGYLNAPNPFDAEGFFDTGDLVERDGAWLRILGRKSEVINVGGNKVFPTEVENTLLELDNVEDVVVRGVSNPLTGQAVVAAVRLAREESPTEFKTRMRLFCRDRIASYKIPVKVQFAETLHSERFKKVRHG
jgi:long-chain acyl-CoA synthetase